MTDKTPIRAVFSGSTATGLAEYQSGEKISVAFGGTGATSHTANSLLLGNGTSAIQSSTITLDGTTFATSDSTTITIAEGLIVTGDLTVQGTTTSIDSSSINVTDRFVFEGSSADEHETTLIVSNPSADRTVTIPNATGQLVLRDTTDTLTNKSINLANNTVTTTLALLNTAVSDATLVDLDDAQTLTNKVINASNNTLSNIGNSSLSNSSITIGDESSNTFDISLGDELSIIGGEGIDTTVTGNLLSIAGEDATTSNKGIASFSSDDFAVSSGAVTVKASGITNTQLAGSIANAKLSNSSITINGSGVSLGGSVSIDTSFTLAADSGSNDSFSTGNTLTFTGGEGIDTTVSDDAITIAGEEATTSNKGVASFSSDNFAVSSGAVTIKDSGVANVELVNSSITIGDESSNTFDINLGDELSVVGGEGVDTTITGNLLTIAGEDATTSNKGVASFSSDNFAVSSGAVTIKDGGVANAELAGSIANAKLSNSSINVTDGSTNTDISLGGTLTFAAGEGIDVGESSGTITFSGEDATTSNKGVASFSSDNFAVSSGAVTIKSGGVVADEIASNAVITAKINDGAVTNAKLANSTFTIGDESSNTFDINLGDELSIVGGEGVDTTVTGNLITIAGEDATTSNKGVASFSTDDFAVSSGAVTVKASGITNTQLAGSIANAKLANSGITVSDGSNSTARALGSTITFSGTTNEVTVAESSGTITVSLPDDVTIGNDLTITGDLTVNGDTTTVSTTNTTATDQLFELGNGRTGSAAGDAGIVIERGDDANLFIGYDESADKFTVGTGTFTGASTGNLSITNKPSNGLSFKLKFFKTFYTSKSMICFKEKFCISSPAKNALCQSKVCVKASSIVHLGIQFSKAFDF